MLCQNAFGAGELCAPWFAAAAACRVCEFVAVDSSRFNVVSGVAVLALEGYALGVASVSLWKVTTVGLWSTLSKVLRSASIRGGSASLFLSIPLLLWSSLLISAGDIGLSWLVVGYVIALDDYLVSLRVKLCVGCFRG